MTLYATEGGIRPRRGHFPQRFLEFETYPTVPFGDLGVLQTFVAGGFLRKDVFDILGIGIHESFGALVMIQRDAVELVFHGIDI